MLFCRWKKQSLLVLPKCRSYVVAVVLIHKHLSLISQYTKAENWQFLAYPWDIVLDPELHARKCIYIGYTAFLGALWASVQ